LTEGNLKKLFEKYRDQEADDKDMVGMKGIMTYCEDLGVSIEDATIYVALDAAQAPAIGEMSKDDFVKGWKQASVTPTLDRFSEKFSTDLPTAVVESRWIQLPSRKPGLPVKLRCFQLVPLSSRGSTAMHSSAARRADHGACMHFFLLILS
jgi:hypothetical protein